MPAGARRGGRVGCAPGAMSWHATGGVDPSVPWVTSAPQGPGAGHRGMPGGLYNSRVFVLDMLPPPPPPAGFVVGYDTTLLHMAAAPDLEDFRCTSMRTVDDLNYLDPDCFLALQVRAGRDGPAGALRFPCAHGLSRRAAAPTAGGRFRRAM